MLLDGSCEGFVIGLGHRLGRWCSGLAEEGAEEVRRGSRGSEPRLCEARREAGSEQRSGGSEAERGDGRDGEGADVEGRLVEEARRGRSGREDDDVRRRRSKGGSRSRQRFVRDLGLRRGSRSGERGDVGVGNGGAFRLGGFTSGREESGSGDKDRQKCLHLFLLHVTPVVGETSNTPEQMFSSSSNVGFGEKNAAG